MIEYITVKGVLEVPDKELKLGPGVTLVEDFSNLLPLVYATATGVTHYNLEPHPVRSIEEAILANPKHLVRDKDMVISVTYRSKKSIISVGGPRSKFRHTGNREDLMCAAKHIVLVPEKDVLTESPGFLSLFNYREIQASIAQRDILLHLLAHPFRIVPEKQLAELKKLIGGTPILEGESFYIRLTGTRRKVSISVFPGWKKKLVVAYFLLCNVPASSTLLLDKFLDMFPRKMIKPAVSILSDYFAQVITSTTKLAQLQEAIH